MNRIAQLPSVVKAAVVAAALAGGCSLLDRHGPPEVLDVKTNYGSDPSVGRGRPVRVTVVTTDPDNDELDFRWVATGGTFEGSGRDTIVDLFQDSVTVVWRAPGIPGAYDLAFEAGDGQSAGRVEAAVRVTVTQGPPTADAGKPRVVTFADGLEVYLDGTGSSDPDGDDLRFYWSQLAGPSVSLRNASGPTPSFVASAPADYAFRLRVADDFAPGTADTSGAVDVTIRVTDRPGRGT